MFTRQYTKSATMVILPLLMLFLFISSATIAADENLSEEESAAYLFFLMEKPKTVKLAAENAEKYLRGVWRLDKKAHVGNGHYVRADEGDDVSLICNNGLLIQVYFNQNSDVLEQVSEQLHKLKIDKNGFISFGSGLTYKPLDQNHMAITGGDFGVVLQRASGLVQTPASDKHMTKADEPEQSEHEKLLIHVNETIEKVCLELAKVVDVPSAKQQLEKLKYYQKVVAEIGSTFDVLGNPGKEEMEMLKKKYLHKRRELEKELNSDIERLRSLPEVNDILKDVLKDLE